MNEREPHALFMYKQLGIMRERYPYFAAVPPDLPVASLQFAVLNLFQLGEDS